MASTGWRKKEGVPVLLRVAEIFWPMMPDLPMPVIMTRLGQFMISATAFSNSESSCSIRE